MRRTLIKFDVQAPGSINELKLIMEELKETRNCSKLATEEDHKIKNNKFEPQSETKEMFI